MTVRRRILACAIGLAIGLGACGSSATPPPASATGASQAPATEGTTGTAPPAETGAPAASGEAASGGLPSPGASAIAGTAADLAALLPDEADGITFTRQSFDGGSIGAAGVSVDPAQLDAVLAANGKSISDVRMAIATPKGGSATETAVVVALQVEGLDSRQLVDVATGSVGGAVTEAALGGKRVLRLGGTGFGVIVYPAGDVLFELLLTSDSTAEAILADLP